MVNTPTRHEICPKKEHYHNLRQENACTNSSLITALAIAAVAMVGVTLAMYFGAFRVSPAGLIGCYVGTGAVDLALIVAIALPCIGGSKPLKDEVKLKEASGDDKLGVAAATVGSQPVLSPIRWKLTTPAARQVTLSRSGEGASKEQSVVFDIEEGSPYIDFDYEVDKHSLVYFSPLKELYHIHFLNGRRRILKIATEDTWPEGRALFATKGGDGYAAPIRKSAP